MLRSDRDHVLSPTHASAGVAHADGGQELGARDLIEQAVVRTLLNSGTVYAVAKGEMPDSTAVAALFRY
jgi:hypothetical protein